MSDDTLLNTILTRGDSPEVRALKARVAELEGALKMIAGHAFARHGMLCLIALKIMPQNPKSFPAA